MQSGELTVTGKNLIEIPLEHIPTEVKVHFKDHFVMVPCNPQNADSLEYEVHTTNKHHNHFVLIIKWNVSSVREVVWHVSF